MSNATISPAFVYTVSSCALIYIKIVSSIVLEMLTQRPHLNFYIRNIASTGIAWGLFALSDDVNNKMCYYILNTVHVIVNKISFYQINVLK